MSGQFLYDTFDLYYKSAITCKNNGNLSGAKKNLLLAAETMFKMAKDSTGELQKSRIAHAERLLEIAEDLSKLAVNKEAAKTPSPSFGGTSGTTQNNTSNGREKNEDNTETKWDAAEIPNISFSDVAGLDDVKESIRVRIILPLRHPELYAAYKKKTGGGILLYGLPGTGKTMIAKAIANEVGAKFFSVKCSDIVAKWFGESEKNIKNLFAAARQEERAIIFFDEFESLAARRGGNSTVMNRIVPELLSQIQGFHESKNTLLLLAATNRPWDIDTAMLRPGRFNELIYVDLPDAEARLFLVNKSLAGVPSDENVSIAEIAALTEGYSGADIEEFCERLKSEPLMRAIRDNGKLHAITRADVEKVTAKVKSSISAKDVADLERFERQQGVVN